MFARSSARPRLATVRKPSRRLRIPLSQHLSRYLCRASNASSALPGLAARRSTGATMRRKRASAIWASRCRISVSRCKTSVARARSITRTERTAPEWHEVASLRASFTQQRIRIGTTIPECGQDRAAGSEMRGRRMVMAVGEASIGEDVCALADRRDGCRPDAASYFGRHFRIVRPATNCVSPTMAALFAVRLMANRLSVVTAPWRSSQRRSDSIRRRVPYKGRPPREADHVGSAPVRLPPGTATVPPRAPRSS